MNTQLDRTYIPFEGSPTFNAVEKRATLNRLIRGQLDEEGYLEVETPVLYARPDVAPMDQFVAYEPGTGERLFLRICPTEHLKRLLVAGFPAVYEISRNFRPGNCSPWHLPEFTSLECTRRDTTVEDMMALTERLILNVMDRMMSSHAVIWNGRTVSFEPPWPRVPVREAAKHWTGIDLEFCRDAAELRAAVCRQALPIPLSDHYGALLDTLISTCVLPHLQVPTFLTEYPWLLGGPAEPVVGLPGYKQRAELFLGTFELANMSSHLTDLESLEAWHRMTLEDSQRLGIADCIFDEHLMRDIGSGLPSSAILGIGLDRVLMLMTGSSCIDEVVAFPAHCLKATAPSQSDPETTTLR